MDQAHLDAYLRHIRQAGDAQMQPCGLLTDALRPIPAQRVGVAHLALRPRFLLADPTGAGKTPTTLAAFSYLKEKDVTLKLVVITTRSAQFQWQEAAYTFLRGVEAAVVGYRASREKMPPTARYAAYDEITLRGADLWITTYATMAKDIEYLLPRLDRFVLVFDEAQTLKNFRTLKANDDRTHTYPAALRLSHKARCCWGLSATPQKNDRLDEIYSVMEVIRPGTFGSYSSFRKSYYILRLVKPMWKIKGTNERAKPFYEIVGTQNLNHLQQVLDPFYLRRPFEVFGAALPELTYETRRIDLDAKQRAVYTDVLKRQLPGATTKLARIAAYTKAQQALSDPTAVGAPATTPNAKLSELLTGLQGPWQGEKVLVYTKYTTVVATLRRALTKAKIAHGAITGEEPTKSREATRQRFAQDPAFNLVLITDAGGEALDLQAARVVVFFDLPWSYGTFLQVVGRARRIGSPHSNVLAVLFTAAHTLEERLQVRLVAKEALIREVVRQGNTATDTLLAGTLVPPDVDSLLEQFAAAQ